MAQPDSANRTPGTLPLPRSLESLSLRASRLPWWAIILALGLILALYGVYTTDLYRRSLNFITGNPQITTSDFQRVTYRVDTQVISGVLVQREGDQLTIRTNDPQYVTVRKDQVAREQRTTANCGLNAPKFCTPAPYIALSLDQRVVEGAFYTETATEYRIQLPNGDIIGVLKVDTRTTRKLTPEGCAPDTAGACQISVTVPPSEITGELVSETPGSYLLQTTALRYLAVNKSQIREVISENAAQCALNNVQSCQDGVFLTGFLAIIAFVFALTLGMVLALMRISANPILRNAATLYIEVVRGIPILVILFIFYFAIGPAIRDGLRIAMPDFTRAILGLGVAYAAFLAEIFRAGIQSISRGQMEAARSLGMTYVQAMRHVILPQAVRVVLPPLGNDFIAMLKDTSLTAAISLHEMSYLAQQLNSALLRPFPPFITLAVVYLLMTLVLSFFVRTIEHRVALPG